MTGQLGLIRALRGLTSDLSSFGDEQFDERRFQQRLEADPRLAFAACWYWIRKLQARLHANDYAGAVAAADRAQTLMWKSSPFFEAAEYHFYAALARAAARTLPRATRNIGAGMRFPLTTCNFRRVRSTALRTSQIGQRLLAPRLRASKGVMSTRAPVRTGHPIGSRERLRPERGSRQ